MEDFQPVDKIVNLSHESLHKNHFGQTHAEVFQLGGECLKLAEVVQLHGGGEVEKHVREVWTPVGQLVQHRVRYELDGQLDVSQRGTESHAIRTYRLG